MVAERPEKRPLLPIIFSWEDKSEADKYKPIIRSQ